MHFINCTNTLWVSGACISEVFSDLVNPHPNLLCLSPTSDCSSQLHAFSLFSAIGAPSHDPVILFLVFSVFCGSLNSVITLLTSPLETPSYVPLLVFEGLFQVLTLISFPGFSTLHLWTFPYQKEVCRTHCCARES